MFLVKKVNQARPVVSVINPQEHKLAKFSGCVVKAYVPNSHTVQLTDDSLTQLNDFDLNSA